MDKKPCFIQYARRGARTPGRALLKNKKKMLYQLKNMFEIPANTLYKEL
jgi:hypothetical protein